jgi:hypothetical protein
MLKSLLAMTDEQELPGRFDGDYDCWVLPEVDARPLELTQLDRELGAMADAEGEDGRWQSPTCILDTDQPDRAYEVEPMDELVLHSEGPGTLHALAGIVEDENVGNGVVDPVVGVLRAHRYPPTDLLPIVAGHRRVKIACA